MIVLREGLTWYVVSHSVLTLSVDVRKLGQNFQTFDIRNDGKKLSVNLFAFSYIIYLLCYYLTFMGHLDAVMLIQEMRKMVSL